MSSWHDLIIKMQIDVDVKVEGALETSIRSWLGNRILDHSKRQETAHALFYDVGREDFLDQLFYHGEPIPIQSRHQQTCDAFIVYIKIPLFFSSDFLI